MTASTARSQRSIQHRRRLFLLSLLFIVLLALALGLGLGLTIGRKSSDNDNDNNNNNDSNPTSSPLPSPSSQPSWLPQVGDSWQILLLNPPGIPSPSSSPTPLTPDVSIYDIDLFDTPASTISYLHSLNKKVLCYFSGGSYEPNRPDSSDFDPKDLGAELDGWPGEKWVRLGSEGIRRIMGERVKLAVEKGCDGVDVDNVDGYQNKNDLDLTADDSISFLQHLSSLTTPLNLTLGLKNAGDIIPAVLPIVHFSVNEQCVDEGECDTFAQFIDAGKPVFHIEYPTDAEAKKPLKKSVMDKYCTASGEWKFSTVLKKMDLDGWVEYCDGVVKETVLNATVPAN